MRKADEWVSSSADVFRWVVGLSFGLSYGCGLCGYPLFYAAVVFGLIGGPLAYYTGYKLGGIRFDDFGMAMVALALGWAAVVPVLLVLAERFNGVEVRPGPATAFALD